MTKNIYIPEAAQKEIEYLFLYEIVLKVENHAISDSLIISFGQIPLKLAQGENSKLAKKNSKTVTIVSAKDKTSIIDTFLITLSGKFLLI